MPVRFHTDGPLGIITLASPERRNALSRDIVGGVLGHLRSPEAAASRAIVIAAEGGAFCAGADIGDLLNAGWIDGDRDGPDPIDLFEAIGSDSRIVVAAVDGMALGGGFELSLSCDLVVASDQATFALPEAGLGVVPNTGLFRIPQMAGARLALELAATGRRLTATEAAGYNLVNAVVPAGTALDAAKAMAANIIGRAPPGALAAIKRGLREAAPVEWQAVRRALQHTSRAEWQEGLGAFSERRKPDYNQFWGSDAHRRSIQDI